MGYRRRDGLVEVQRMIRRHFLPFDPLSLQPKEVHDLLLGPLAPLLLGVLDELVRPDLQEIEELFDALCVVCTRSLCFESALGYCPGGRSLKTLAGGLLHSFVVCRYLIKGPL
jgi:hypothetical protein